MAKERFTGLIPATLLHSQIENENKYLSRHFLLGPRVRSFVNSIPVEIQIWYRMLHRLTFLPTKA